ncbi:MAG TPA: hypothetical protein VFP68_08825 [Burkholderiaceae bacterium]|nr:hypothetical protein [Burkholderiaceae bacterium]
MNRIVGSIASLAEHLIAGVERTMGYRDANEARRGNSRRVVGLGVRLGNRRNNSADRMVTLRINPGS